MRIKWTLYRLCNFMKLPPKIIILEQYFKFQIVTICKIFPIIKEANVLLNIIHYLIALIWVFGSFSETTTLQWRHNDHNGVLYHQPHNCLLSRLFRHRSKKTSKLHVTGVCERNSPVMGEFLSQRASNTKNISICLLHPEKTWQTHISI